MSITPPNHYYHGPESRAAGKNWGRKSERIGKKSQPGKNIATFVVQAKEEVVSGEAAY